MLFVSLSGNLLLDSVLKPISSLCIILNTATLDNIPTWKQTVYLAFIAVLTFMAFMDFLTFMAFMDFFAVLPMILLFNK